MVGVLARANVSEGSEAIAQDTFWMSGFWSDGRVRYWRVRDIGPKRDRLLSVICEERRTSHRY